MKRTAQCCCGALTIETRTEPERTVICHCVECQRRTGSAFGVSAFFKAEDVDISGPSTAYVRIGTSGKRLEAHFCPTCGSTVYWLPEFLPGVIGVGLGAFADPSFPAPAISAWERSRHPWVKLGHDILHLPQGRTS